MTKRHLQSGTLATDSTQPTNTAGMEFYDIREYGVSTWGPNPDGKPPQAQVHLRFVVGNALHNLPMLVLRMRSRRAVSDLVELLTEYRDIVWDEDGTLTEWAERGSDE